MIFCLDCDYVLDFVTPFLVGAVFDSHDTFYEEKTLRSDPSYETTTTKAKGMTDMHYNTLIVLFVTPTDRPKLVRNLCVINIEVFGGVFVLSIGC